MGYVFSGEHLISLSFTPLRGPIYKSDWCWSARVLCSTSEQDPGPEVGRALETVRTTIPHEYSLRVCAVPAWNWETLHPYALQAAYNVRDRILVTLADIDTGHVDLLDVSLWEHGQGPRCPVLIVSREPQDGRPFQPID